MAGFEEAWRSDGMRGVNRFWRTYWEKQQRWFHAATFASRLGEVDAAFELLERAYQDRDPDCRYLAGFHELDPIRADPRFADLARRMNLPLARS